MLNPMKYYKISVKNKTKKETNIPFAIIFLEFSTPLILLLTDTDHTLWPGRNASCSSVSQRKQIGLAWVFFKKKYWATYFPKELVHEHLALFIYLLIYV